VHQGADRYEIQTTCGANVQTVAHVDSLLLSLCAFGAIVLQTIEHLSGLFHDQGVFILFPTFNIDRIHVAIGEVDGFALRLGMLVAKVTVIRGYSMPFSNRPMPLTLVECARISFDSSAKRSHCFTK